MTEFPCRPDLTLEREQSTEAEECHGTCIPTTLETYTVYSLMFHQTSALVFEVM